MPVPETADVERPCVRCRKRRLYFDGVTLLGLYRHDLRESVIRMKQSAHEALTLAVGLLLAARLRDCAAGEPPDWLVAMPTHWTRRFSRGVNVSELLCESIHSELGLPVRRNVLKCRRKTKKQGVLGPAERIANVRGAFAVNARYDLARTRVVLVDDVMTTGATANEVAKMLRRAGAASIHVAVVARGVGSE